MAELVDKQRSFRMCNPLENSHAQHVIGTDLILYPCKGVVVDLLQIRRQRVQGSINLTNGSLSPDSLKLEHSHEKSGTSLSWNYSKATGESKNFMSCQTYNPEARSAIELTMFSIIGGSTRFMNARFFLVFS